MRLFLHQHLIVESIKRIMTTFTFDALRAATVLTMYNNAALSLWKKMDLECFWSRILNFEHKMLHFDVFLVISEGFQTFLVLVPILAYQTTKFVLSG